MRNKQFLILGCLFWMNVQFAKGDEFIKNVVQLNEKDGQGKTITVLVQKAEYPSGYFYKERFWGQADHSSLVEPSLPKYLIRGFEVRMSNKPIEVPLSAFMDLSDPAQVNFYNINKDSFMIVLVGSDAAGGYKAILTFKNDQLAERKVMNLEFKKTYWEETIYSWPNVK